MKTSTMLILSAVAVIFISLTAFNFDLKKSFAEGNYKNRFYGFDFIPVKNIHQIDIQNADKINLNIEQGDKEGIWIDESDRKKVTWSKSGQTLKIELTKENSDPRLSVYLKNMTIIVNKISKVSARAGVTGDTERRWTNGFITIKGLQQDHLELSAENFTSISLSANQLQKLIASIGMKGPGAAQLELSKDNIIQSADFRVEGESSLKLDNSSIVKTNYQLSDQASVTLSGKALQALIK